MSGLPNSASRSMVPLSKTVRFGGGPGEGTTRTIEMVPWKKVEPIGAGKTAPFLSVTSAETWVSPGTRPTSHW